ncbi:unnamed protein product [Brachionus calyciflorus]|uniref:Reverse transcriptase Ty1/copia-type domain-containing protein n=1 Tax=Brachionus calyciflorus TaxID=104777 RepID=A0A813W6M7_9BILA|nr:unnamed protein product [Brachionus calyciflorus]
MKIILLTVPRKSNRISRPPDRYRLDDYSKPTTFDEAINSPMKKNWKEAIKSEINSFEENDIKRNAKNEPVRDKARLVAKEYDQEMGIDYQETFAPVVKLRSLRLLIAIAVQEVDISSAFLYCDIDEKLRNLHRATRGI